MDTVCFEIFLRKFAATYCEDLYIVQVDDGAFHRSKYLQVPANVILLFQPPHTPEVNPIERLWQEIKRYLNWENFLNLDDLKAVVWQRIRNFSPSFIASVTGWDFILSSLSVSAEVLKDS